MRAFLILFICWPLFAAPPGLKAAPPGLKTEANLSDSFKMFHGNASLNQAAGQGHQQVNTRLITIGEQPTTSLRIEQVNSIAAPNSIGVDAHVRIQGEAFSQANGISGVNQSAGIGNQNINVMRISVGAVPNSLDDAVLSQSTAISSPLNSTALAQEGERIVETSNRAFAGSKGVVQLNQSAGVGNKTANSLSIRVTD